MTGKALLSTILGIILSASLWAQEDGKGINIPINRQLFHENIIKEKNLLLGSDGKQDDEFTLQGNVDAGRLATAAINNQVDAIRYLIETDNKIEQRLKPGYLVGLTDILRHMRTGWRKREVLPSHFAQIFSLYKKLIEVNSAKESIIPYVQHFPYDIAYTATLPRVFEENPNYNELKDLLILKYSAQYPGKTFYQLTKYTNSKHTDSLIKAVGRQYPEQLYSYAQAGNSLGYKIRSIKDDNFVKTVVGLSEMKSGQIYFPFLDNLVKGKVTMTELDAAKDDRVKYYRLLVKTQMDYARRALSGDTAVGFTELTNRLQKKASDEFVNEINALHEATNAVRFKCLQELTPQELYYLAVLTDGLIYTSSYTAGVYPLMMQKMNNRGDSLLLSLSFDHYRKFLRQAAGYNTLKNFFATFKSKDDATAVMTAFVNGLEKSKGLEDGVDVADSYASLYETLPDLAKQMLTNIKTNYQRNARTGNKRGVAIYNILDKLFQSADPTKNINLTKELGIPPVYNVPFDNFTNEKGEIITQMFFYGDEDGMMDFDIFVRTFSNDPKWKLDQSNSKFVVAKTTSGVPIYLYANRPLANTPDEDYVAQNAMQEFFEKNNLSPTVTFHRGHSYHAPTSVSYITPTNRVVFMGSCGGFFLIDSILKKSSDAHIISSKQTGYRDINLPFIRTFLETLRLKKNIDWISFWKEFTSVAKVTGIEDYIPPYKNLGALFIKAYKKETGEEDI
ncbi:hypothetical protein U0035_10675 [Niabella yanshanensis]|uniref:Uncharacterized protein n=1 Tax=Niabella yanshanensis TaxID=577386 RepID=A0ABZ0WBE0_9BACT|nr:hypothetical protein [Niabella yanshanensis]WQD40612.1 hypothetical protein U0035_10675 [Niabella yanshanensis]